MKSSLLTVSFFFVGCLVGILLGDSFTSVSGRLSKYILYFLMFQVSFSIGNDCNISTILKSLRPSFIIIPFATICGTLLFTTFAALFIDTISLPECLAIGSGFAYYSLSSILITDFKTVTEGVQTASALGALALISNILRELITLLGAPLLVKYFSPLAPICTGGATTMDTTLPIIIKYSGKDMALIAIFHGIAIDFSVPFLVSYFCLL